MAYQTNLGDGTMAGTRSLPAQANSTDIKAGDIDEDGHQDLVLISEGAGFDNTVVDLYFGDGQGGFVHRTAAGGLGPRHEVLTDLNGDGHLDVAMTNYQLGFDGTDVSVLLGRGDGTFGPEHRYTTGDDPAGIAAADLDGDGAVDLAVTRDDVNTGSQRLVILLGNGDGTFRPGASIRYEGPFLNVVTADWNGDGEADLAIAGSGTRDHLILTNLGGLQFAIQRYRAGFTAWDAVAADVDGRRGPDLVTATLGSSATGDVSYLRNRGDGTFTVIRFESGTQSKDVAVADFDGDGRNDLAIATGNSPTGIIDLQRPDGTLNSTPLYPTPYPAGAVDTGDVDGDGDLDVASTADDISSGEDDQIIVFDNDGAGHLEARTSINGGLSSFGGLGDMAFADVDGDRDLDLVWDFAEQNAPTQAYVVSRNLGDWNFGPPEVTDASPNGIGTLAMVDIDHDGDIDLVGGSSKSVAIRLNDGTGHFTHQVLLVPTADFGSGLIAADLNGDGNIDFATTHPGALVGGDKRVSVVLGLGGLRFAPFKTYTVGAGPLDVAAGDVNGDGFPDLATSNAGGDDIARFDPETTSVLLNDGHGRFPAVATYPGEDIHTYLSETVVEMGDMDRDGHLDVVAANAIGNDANVLYGVGDGRFVSPPLRYGMHTLLEDLAVADLNGDGAWTWWGARPSGPR
jgi:hypothetical protein